MSTIQVNKELTGGIVWTRQKLREKFLLSLLTFQLLLPVICLLAFIYLGKFLNPFSAYFLISVAVLLFTFTCLLQKASPAVYAFFLAFLVLQGVTVFGHIVALGPLGAIEGLRTISNFYFYWYLGYACYFTFYRTGRMEVLLRWVIGAGVFISVVNIIHFFFNTVLGNYAAVKAYLEILNQNLADYLDMEGTNGFLRHAGYFLDTHSQFYIPLATLIILQIEKFPVKFKAVKIILIVVSILLSGVKTAYLIMFIMWAIILLRTNLKAAINFFLLVGVLCVGVLLFFNEMVVNMVIMIFTHDMDILIEHIYHNPVRLFNEYTAVFFIGGDESLVGTIYSEVYLITTMYYIGLAGVLLYLSPLVVFLFNRKGKYYLGFIIFIYFIFTLLHYPVFKVGINNIVSALPVVYLLAAINDFKLRNDKNS
ncbi:hypothetical protein CLV51_101265 [Chitinophaga niastensis]|uniref:O-antigen ligase-like membrane protein n=1 Tax=Chitinophaga niastensis TaxID=536980 RepID=A0A2P8HRW0_CHINA|nr:hypothetical protein [Chitinophaga niastensis]PSL48935.1 hypothetical protein CLV51_101265 [Chitinophaga niastensis]